MDEVHVYMWLPTASNKYTAGNKLGFFLVHSTFLLARASLWPERPGRPRSRL